LNGDAVATWIYPVGHPPAEGHFPGNPIIPGAVLLRDIVAAVRAGDDAALDVRSAKFHRPVRPGDAVELEWSRVGGEVRFSCALAGSEEPAVTGVLRPRQS
jgi:3-hydroxyacyl-[acyl-carrier-protein] dehydratase